MIRRVEKLFEVATLTPVVLANDRHHPVVMKQSVLVQLFSTKIMTLRSAVKCFSDAVIAK